jgi:hypothetical protein
MLQNVMSKIRSTINITILSTKLIVKTYPIAPKLTNAISSRTKAKAKNKDFTNELYQKRLPEKSSKCLCLASYS